MHIYRETNVDIYIDMVDQQYIMMAQWDKHLSDIVGK